MIFIPSRHEVALRLKKSVLLILFIFIYLRIFSAKDIPFILPDTLNDFDLSVYQAYTPDTTLPGNANIGYLNELNLGANTKNLAEAQEILDNAIEYTGNLQTIASGDWVRIPLKITKTLSNIQYTMAIGKVEINAGFSELSVYMSIELPNGRKLIFGSPSIKLNSTGGLLGDTKLGLFADYAIDLGANKSLLVLKRMENGSFGGTYVSIDCDGFKELGIDAQVIFSRDVIVPVDAAGNPVVNKHVQGNFKVVASDWNDIVASVDLPRFAIPEYADIAFGLNSATIDISDLRNAPNTKFPVQYQGETSPLWRGVYIQSLEAILPKQIKRRNSTGRTSVMVNNLIIDKTGVSGNLGAKNLLALHEGAMDKWAYSLDTLQVGFVQNQLIHFGMAGTIMPPVMDNKRDIGIEYSAFIDATKNFTLNASIPEAVQFNFVQAAKVSIRKDSKIDVTIADDNFYPSATLHGSMEIKASLKGKAIPDTINKNGLNLAKIDFEGMEIKTNAPLLQIHHFSLTTGRLANFPVQINKLEFKSSESVGSLFVSLSLNLLKDEEGGNGLRTMFHINSTMSNPEVHHWVFDNSFMDALKLDFDIGPVKLNGGLNIFDDDPIYGTGFCGNINAIFKISNHKKVEAEAATIFGANEEFRYWYADAMALGFTLPLGGIVNLTGFGGGAYKHMRMKSNTNSSIECRSSTGVIYVPDGSVGLGIKASVFLTATTESLFAANATLELTCNSTGGINQVQIFGEGQFMVKKDFALPGEVALNIRLTKMCSNSTSALQAEDKHTASKSNGSVSFQLRLNLQFDEDIYHGAFAVYANIANGRLKGNASPPGNLAGAVDLYISPSFWHFYLGNYDEKLSLSTDLAQLQVAAGAYFMTGNDLKPPPALDPKIAQELGISINQVSDDRSGRSGEIATGQGFALGANLHINYDNQGRRLIVRIHAGAGFEFYCMSFGSDRKCASGYGPPIGANGWRASGLIYLYANVYVKFWGVSASPGVALMVNGQIPNPNYFEAYLKIIGIKINFKLGEPCPF
jgi:hypothetical protein